MSLGKIFEGWKNKLFPKEELKEYIASTAKARMEICGVCDFNSSVAKEKGIPFSSSWRPDQHCISCQCTLSAKTACLSCACPIEKWLAVASEQEDIEIDNILKDE